jgi:hypothetical protein
MVLNFDIIKAEGVGFVNIIKTRAAMFEQVRIRSSPDKRL